MIIYYKDHDLMNIKPKKWLRNWFFTVVRKVYKTDWETDSSQ